MFKLINIYWFSEEEKTEKGEKGVTITTSQLIIFQ